MGEMHATQLVDSSFRASYLPDAAGTPLCLGRMILGSEISRSPHLLQPSPLGSSVEGVHRINMLFSEPNEREKQRQGVMAGSLAVVGLGPLASN